MTFKWNPFHKHIRVGPFSLQHFKRGQVFVAGFNSRRLNIFAMYEGRPR